MNKWFVSDIHFAHKGVKGGIIKYCNRPFRDIDHMNRSIIRNWNERVKPDDVVYHVGDFAFRGGKEAGYSKNKFQYWEEQLNGKIIHILGNHCLNNSGRELIIRAEMLFGGYHVLTQHIPPDDYSDIPEGIDFMLVGHVHNLFKHKFINNIPIINVGVDVWNFRPVSMQEILKYYHRIRKEIKKQ